MGKRKNMSCTTLILLSTGAVILSPVLIPGAIMAVVGMMLIRIVLGPPIHM